MAPDAAPLFATPEIEAYLRARVAQLPHGTTYTDHVFVGPGLLVAERVLLEALGVDVTNDPPPVDPLAPRVRKREVAT